jgi:hypothetical protein
MGEGGMYDMEWRVSGTDWPHSLWIHKSVNYLYNINSHVMSLYDLIITTFCFFKDEDGYMQLPLKSPN